MSGTPGTMNSAQASNGCHGVLDAKMPIGPPETEARNAFDRMTAHSGLQYNIKAEINNVGLLFKFVRQTKYVTVLSESTVIDETGLVAIPVIGSGSTVADGAEGFKNEMEGCIHTLKNGYQKASAREFIHMLHQSTAIWKTTGE